MATGSAPAPRTSDESGTLDRSLHQGRFGEHLVQLLATGAGFVCDDPPDLGDGIDLVVSKADSKMEVLLPPKVELQVKTVRLPTLVNKGTEISYDLEVQHYDLLRKPGGTSRYLVIVVVPENLDTGYWLGNGADFYSFNQVAYWRDLRGEPQTGNTSTIAVRVPLRQRYTRDTVHQHMRQAKERLEALVAKAGGSLV